MALLSESIQARCGIPLCLLWWLPEVNREPVQNVTKIYARNCRQVSERYPPHPLYTHRHNAFPGAAIDQLTGRQKAS